MSAIDTAKHGETSMGNLIQECQSFADKIKKDIKLYPGAGDAHKYWLIMYKKPAWERTQTVVILHAVGFPNKPSPLDREMVIDELETDDEIDLIDLIYGIDYDIVEIHTP